MLLRQLGYRVQELEAGPYTFLLSDSLPLAYREDSQYFRTTMQVTKAQTRHLNQWLKDRKYLSVPQGQIIAAWNDVSRFNMGKASKSVFQRLRQVEAEVEALKAELMPESRRPSQ